MAGKSKEDYLYEFASTGLGNNCSSVEDLERRFYNWMVRNDYRLVKFGKDYRNNQFEKSVDYTAGVLEKDPHLASLFGLSGGFYRAPSGNSYGGSYGGQWTPNGRSYGGTQRGSGAGYGRGGSARQRTSGGRKNTGARSGGGYSDSEGYSLKGMFNHYKNRAKGNTQSGGISPIGMLLIFAVAITLIYKILGPAVYSFLTSGIPFKLICFAIGGFLSYKMLRSKNMGWPLPVKLLVLFAIWVTLLNYDF